jgi:hypothetical protein
LALACHRNPAARCAGPRRIVGAVIEPRAVRWLLAGLGLAPERRRGRCPPADPRAIAPTTGARPSRSLRGPRGEGPGPPAPTSGRPGRSPTVPGYGSRGGRGAGRGDRGGHPDRETCLAIPTFPELNPDSWPGGP